MLYEKINVYLANQLVTYTKLHNLHWYIQGSAFFTLHGKFEELYNQAAGRIDEVAERLLAMEQTPVASMAKALKLVTIKELDEKQLDKDAAITILFKDLQARISDTSELIAMAEKEGDHGTAGLFADYLTADQKLRWMIKSYLA